MNKFHTKITLLIFFVLIFIIPIKSISDISKAFPDMSTVFERIYFYDENNDMKRFSGYENKVLLVFFGYTHCPDVCPTTVLDMAKVMKGLGAQSSEVLPMFISVDYDRDNYKKVREYVDFFDNRIAALTSDKKNIDALTKFFKTKYEFVEPLNKGYIVEHSSNIYILDRELQVKKIIPNGIPSAEITRIVEKFL
jgi:protein SCO1/2|tara:strand:- start:438 stop:1019 length:582 start_codon:yes stop_codon:yes gene_type:complete